MIPGTTVYKAFCFEDGGEEFLKSSFFPRIYDHQMRLVQCWILHEQRFIEDPDIARNFYCFLSLFGLIISHYGVM